MALGGSPTWSNTRDNDAEMMWWLYEFLQNRQSANVHDVTRRLSGRFDIEIPTFHGKHIGPESPIDLMGVEKVLQFLIKIL